MKYLLGFMGGLLAATALSVGAQWVPADAPLDRKLELQKQEQYLRNERAFERAVERDWQRVQDAQDPCRH